MLLRSAMDDWDIHIEVCPECLIARMHLCIEGQIIVGRVETIREKLHALEPGTTADDPTHPNTSCLTDPLTGPTIRTR